MSISGPVIAVVLALIFATGIGVIAWKMSSDKFLNSFDHDSSEGDDTKR
jgi:hypothetical protein